MFNSFSNWIKLPQNMPNVNMPKIPNLFGGNQDSGEAASATSGGAQEQAATAQPQTEQIQHAQTSNQAETNATDAAASAPATADPNSQEHHNFPNVNIDIDPTKAFGQAKELGSNIGSMFLFSITFKYSTLQYNLSRFYQNS